MRTVTWLLYRIDNLTRVDAFEAARTGRESILIVEWTRLTNVKSNCVPIAWVQDKTVGYGWRCFVACAKRACPGLYESNKSSFAQRVV